MTGGERQPGVDPEDRWTSTVTAEDYVRRLYEVCLGRAADPGGLEFWTARLRATGDAGAVLVDLMSSEEAQLRNRTAGASESAALAQRALAALARAPRIVDIGAQSLGEGTHAYSSLARMTRVDVVGFDPLADRLEERAATEAEDGDLTLLPYAVGDGGEHTLHVNNDDATSSLLPLNTEHNAAFNHLSTLHTTRVEQVATRRLDDVLPSGPVDFLKLDVQGAELMVLQHAAATLALTAVVHCEVEFGPIYAGQPLYADVHTELAAHGFYLVDFLDVARYHYLDLELAVGDRLLWADAVFFRETSEPSVLVAQALIAAAVYGKPTLAAHLLRRAGR